MGVPHFKEVIGDLYVNVVVTVETTDSLAGPTVSVTYSDRYDTVSGEDGICWTPHPRILAAMMRANEALRNG